MKNVGWLLLDIYNVASLYNFKCYLHFDLLYELTFMSKTHENKQPYSAGQKCVGDEIHFYLLQNVIKMLSFSCYLMNVTKKCFIFLQVLTVQMMIVPVKVMKCHGNKCGCPLTVTLITTLSGEKTTGQCLFYHLAIRVFMEAVLYKDVLLTCSILAMNAVSNLWAAQ